MRKFNGQAFANSAWAFATVNHRDGKLLASLAIAAQRRLSECNGQGLANTAWTFATVSHRDGKLFVALAIAAARLLHDFNL